MIINKLSYYKNGENFKKYLLSKIRSILKDTNYELILKLGDVTLLQDKGNIIESSTAIGFCLEEYISVKLICANEKIKRPPIKTKKSYDLYYEIENNTKIMINIKANKKNNNAIAAINNLYNDYCITDPNQEKMYFVLKLDYKITDGRKLKIKNVDGFYLESVNLESHKQDNRNWSTKHKANSGRLQITKKFLEEKLIEKKDISYENTKKQIEGIYNNNYSKVV